MATFGVHASWRSESDVPDDAVLMVNEIFSPDDEDLCTWVDQAEPRRIVVTFDVESATYATAALECLTAVAGVPKIEPRLGTLEEVGATDEEGYLVVSADDFEELSHLAD